MVYLNIHLNLIYIYNIEIDIMLSYYVKIKNNI